MWRNRIGLSFCISSNEISAPLFILADGLILRTPNYDCRRISWRCVSSLNGAHYGTASRGLAKPFLCVCLCVCVWLSFFFPTFFSSCSCSSSPCVGSALLSGRPTEKEETLDVPWFDYGPPVGLSIRVWLGFIQVLFSLTFFLLLCVLFSFFFSSIRRVSSVRFRDSGHDFPGFRRVLFFGLFFLDWPPHRLPPITRKKKNNIRFSRLAVSRFTLILSATLSIIDDYFVRPLDLATLVTLETFCFLYLLHHLLSWCFKKYVELCQWIDSSCLFSACFYSFAETLVETKTVLCGLGIEILVTFNQVFFLICQLIYYRSIWESKHKSKTPTKNEWCLIKIQLGHQNCFGALFVSRFRSRSRDYPSLVTFWEIKIVHFLTRLSSKVSILEFSPFISFKQFMFAIQ